MGTEPPFEWGHSGKGLLVMFMGAFGLIGAMYAFLVDTAFTEDSPKNHKPNTTPDSVFAQMDPDKNCWQDPRFNQ